MDSLQTPKRETQDKTALQPTAEYVAIVFVLLLFIIMHSLIAL